MIPTKDKKYRVTIEFEVGGDLSHLVDEDYLGKDILEELNVVEKLGEVEIWGEAFGDYEDVWTYFLHSNPTIKLDEIDEFSVGKSHENLEIVEKPCFTIYIDGGDTQYFESPYGNEINRYYFMGFGDGINPYHAKQLKWVDVMLETVGVFLNRKTVNTYREIVKKGCENKGYFDEEDILLPNELKVSSNGMIYYHIQDEEMGRGWSVLMELDSKKKTKTILKQDHRDNIRDFLFDDWVQHMGVDLEFVKVNNVEDYIK